VQGVKNTNFGLAAMRNSTRLFRYRNKTRLHVHVKFKSHPDNTELIGSQNEQFHFSILLMRSFNSLPNGEIAVTEICRAENGTSYL